MNHSDKRKLLAIHKRATWLATRMQARIQSGSNTSYDAEEHHALRWALEQLATPEELAELIASVPGQKATARSHDPERVRREEDAKVTAIEAPKRIALLESALEGVLTLMPRDLQVHPTCKIGWELLKR